MDQRPIKADHFAIGTILTGYGLKGEVNTQLEISNMGILDDQPTLRATYPDGSVGTLKLECMRNQGKKVLLSFKGVEDRNAADALRGVRLYIGRDHLPPLEEGEFYLGDLAGYRVITGEREEVGVVQEVWDLPANEVLRVQSGEREILIPFTEEVVEGLDHTQGEIRINVIEGLLD